jgi:membrane protease YdiL (CAAX protease family)
VATSKSSQKRRKHVLEKANLLTSLLLVLPLLVFYEIGVLFTDVMNGADFITQTLLRLVGMKGFLAIQAGIVVVFIGFSLYLRRDQSFDFSKIVPVLLESGIYALTMGTLILFVMTDLIGIDPRLAAGGGSIQEASLLDKVVLSVGAGFYEELVFRLILLSGLTFVGDRVLKLRRWIAVLLAFGITSVLFSAAHHIGPLGEPFRVGVFVYRMMAGLFFACLFQFRSFPIAVYTHALYDIYVLVLG